MRISCLAHDAGYEEWTSLLSQGKNVKVFLNGVLMDNVVIADDQKDEIVCHASPIRVDNATGECAVESYYGRVSIEVCDPEPVPDTFQVSLVENSVDITGDGDLPSDVFCFKTDFFVPLGADLAVLNGVRNVWLRDALELDLAPNSGFEVDYGSEPSASVGVDEFGHTYFEEPDDFVIFDEFSDIEDSLSRMLSERL